MGKKKKKKKEEEMKQEEALEEFFGQDEDSEPDEEKSEEKSGGEESKEEAEDVSKEDIKEEDKKKEDKSHMAKKKKKKKKSKKKARKNLGDELIEVYETAGDELTSVTTLEHKRRTWQRKLGIILLFLIAVFIGVAAVSWVIWGSKETFSSDNVTFSVTAPEEAYSGQEVTYLIEYSNSETAGFRKSEVELRFPPGFIFKSADPEPTTGDNLWDLGSLSGGERGEIEVKGQLVGRPDVDTTVSGVFRYWPANFSSEFQEVASGQTLMSPAKLAMRIDGPEQVLVGQPANYSVVLTNPQEEGDIENFRVEIFFPEEFTIEETRPEPNEGQVWDFEKISPEEELEIQIDGYFSQGVGDTAEVIANMSLKGGGDDYFDQKEERMETNVVEGDLIVNLIANGSTKDQSLQWGDTLNLSINYENSSETTLSDLTAIAYLESRYRAADAERGTNGAFDWDGLVDSNRGSIKDVEETDDNSLQRTSITWTSDDVDSLETLDPEGDGTINIQIPLLSAEKAKQRLNLPEEVSLVLMVDVIVGKTGDVTEELTIASNPINIALNSDLVMDAHARYFTDSGEQLGSGPLPPQVGEQTTYRVIVELTNSLHEVQDLIVSTTLPGTVNWLNRYEVSAGEIEFRSSSKEIAWRLNKLPLDVDKVVLGFDVGLIPSESDIDEIVNLTKKLTMTATDSVTGGKIIQTIVPLDTGVERDDQASDKGLIVP